MAYAYHYRNLDSVEYYATLKEGLHVGPDAEQYNNLAFVCIAKMDYAKAEQLLREIPTFTDNQLELLVCYVQQMRLCQRRSRNREFYEYRELAYQALNRINEERALLSEQQQRRLIYAESELAIVNSTYYYYVGLERQSVEALQALNIDEVRRDTAQYLNYLYNVGAGGILTDGTPEQIRNDEIDYLNRCLSIAQRFHYPYFEAQAKEALADHTADLTMAEEALALFQQYGDVYQIAGAYRTMASCHHALGNDMQALECLQMALADSAIYQAPDLVASIREQMSVAFAAVNDKPQSDYNRNLYLDLQEQTRQDRELEARAAMLDEAVGQLNWMILAVILAILLLLFLLWLFNYWNKKQKQDSQLDEMLEQKNEELAMAWRRVRQNERRHLEQRAKVSLVVSILPFIDRIIHEVKQMEKDGQGKEEQLEYVRELTDKINEYNDVLTHWIQLRQGELILHVESFALQPLFDMVARSKASFQMKGLTLEVQPTDALVKADRVLTLFMLNTLADNARKFTPAGGTVSMAAIEQADYVEISVSDTGCGMTPDELAHVFDAKPITDTHGHQGQKLQSSHGFGLMNCKGIIEKYRKLSQLFGVCAIAAESEQGRGSRFFFRLPKGIRHAVLLLFILCAHGQALHAMDPLSQAHIYADSAYFSNINGTYERTLLFADSCRKYLNLHYQQSHPGGQVLMQHEGNPSQVAPEIRWLHDSVATNYQIILDIRNESAVAALALHEWQLYIYNNKVYTQLFKELSADSTIEDYCRMMQQSQTNKRIAVVLLVLLLLLILPAYYLLYYRHRLDNRFRRENMQLTNLEMADDELRRAELENSNLHVANAVLDNCLSALKHETMYYPSRIRQLVDAGDVASLAEVVHYYRELYGLLCEQAIRQVERSKIHVRPVSLAGRQVLGDANLLEELFEILKGHMAVADVEDHPQYLHYTVDIPGLQLTEQQEQRLFTPGTDHIPYLLCRQIVRDHGEATNRHGCGIWAEHGQIHITLPKAKEEQ